MKNDLFVYNTLTRTKELFQPMTPPFVGMYVCGPTVYGDPHLGHARPAIAFDLVYRYLLHLGYKVRYVRNITDVGHLEHDEDDGEDKIEKKARLEKMEPMEIAQLYSDRYFVFMEALNVKRPGIEPRASGHIIEQIHLIQQILDAGYAYEVNGSVYFDITKYDKKYHYGILSGRILEDLISSTRTLDGQDEKRNPADFALWKKSQPEHIMRWPSPWSDGFPGWHLECSAMSCKYLGEQFDIHGGGMDLLFPHHESEIAQSQIANHKPPVRYWLHNNMVTINGKKMGKSLGNFITLEQFFTGDHPALERAYTPMTIRFFILQAHYRSTVDFSNEALQASEKGLKKLMAGIGTLEQIKPSSKSTFDIANLERSCYDAMNDDFNSPVLIANLFEGIRIINSAKDGKESLTAGNLKSLKELFRIFITEILGLKDDSPGQRGEVIDGLMNLIMDIRENARVSKDFKTSDKIRGTLQNLNITIKDTRDGATWKLE